MSKNQFTRLSLDTDDASSTFAIGWVTRVIYGPYLADGVTPDPLYTDVTSIGSIEYVLYNSSQFRSATGNSNRLAKPIFSFINHYPTENEFVYLVMGPSVEQNEEAGTMTTYYLPPFGLWRAPNHNAFANLAEYAAFVNATALTNQQTQQGQPNRANTTPTEYPLGNGFIEKSDIQSLKPYTGDTLLEGRFGQSIRFGSSLDSNKATCPWAVSQNDGDPIIIISNGQGVNKTVKEGYELTVENINVDQSSIYLTAGQAIQIDNLTTKFPLSSWGYKGDVDKPEQGVTVFITPTIAPKVNETLSAVQQDFITNASGDQPGQYQFIEPTTRIVDNSMPEEPPPPLPVEPTEAQIAAYVDDYIAYYRVHLGEDGFDGYSKDRGAQIRENLPKTKVKAPIYLIYNALDTSPDRQPIDEVESIGTRLQSEINNGKKIAVYNANNMVEVVDQTPLKLFNAIVTKLQSRYYDANARSLKPEYR